MLYCSCLMTQWVLLDIYNVHGLDEVRIQGKWSKTIRDTGQEFRKALRSESRDLHCFWEAETPLLIYTNGLTGQMCINSINPI